MKKALCLVAALAFSASAMGDIIISEIWPGGIAGAELMSDWFELTNTGPAAVNPTGWYYDDNSNDPTSNDPLIGITSIAPGESVIYLVSWEDSWTNEANAAQAFTDVWGAANLVGVQIGTVTGGGGLGGGGDQVNIYDNNIVGAGVIASQSHLAADPASYVYNPVTMSWNDELAQDGVYGAFTSATQASDAGVFAIGSPGVIPEPAAVLLLAFGAMFIRRR